MKHPATQKAELRERLQVDRVLSMQQITRLGLRRVVGWLDLPFVMLTLRLRSNDAGSDHDVILVALTEEDLRLPPHELMHLLLLAEIRHLRTGTAGRVSDHGWIETWQHLSLSGRPRGNKADAEILCDEWLPAPEDRNEVPSIWAEGDIAVEADAGYGWRKVDAKLVQAAADGYTGVVWGTSLRIRPPQLIERVRWLHARGQLEGLRWVEALYVNPIEPNPYRARPRAKCGALKASVQLA